MSELNLASVEEAFSHWRTKRHSRSEPIPEALWSMALGLYPQHKRSNICRHLRLSGSQFKQRLETTGDSCANNGFVLASRNEVSAMPVAGTDIQLTLQGQVRSMTLCFDVHALAQVLASVSGLL